MNDQPAAGRAAVCTTSALAITPTRRSTFLAEHPAAAGPPLECLECSARARVRARFAMTKDRCNRCCSPAGAFPGRNAFQLSHCPRTTSAGWLVNHSGGLSRIPHLIDPDDGGLVLLSLLEAPPKMPLRLARLPGHNLPTRRGQTLGDDSQIARCRASLAPEPPRWQRAVGAGSQRWLLAPHCARAQRCMACPSPLPCQDRPTRSPSSTGPGTPHASHTYQVGFNLCAKK